MRICRSRICISILAFLPCVWVGAGVRKPTPEEQLRGKGYEVTQAGLKSALGSEDDWTVVYAIRVIGKKGREDASKYVSELRRLMASPSELVRVEAAMVVARKERTADAIKVLIEEVNEGRDIRRRLDAAGTLAELGHSEGFHLVERVLLGDSSTMAQRIHAARLLRKFLGLGQDAVDVVPTAIRCIEKYPELTGCKQGAAANQSAHILFHYLADCLGEAGDERAVPALMRARGFPDERVASAAERALERIRERKKQRINP